MNSDRESKVFILMAISVVALSLGTLMWQKCSAPQDRKERANQVIARIKDIGMPNFPIVQGVPIFYNGVVTVVGSPRDPDFEIITMDQPLLRRNVKVLCWREVKVDGLTRFNALID